MKGLTERQEQVLGFIAETIRERGYPPTIREIGTALQIRSTNGVNDHLKALERKGFIERSGAKSRAILVVALPESLSGYETQVGVVAQGSNVSTADVASPPEMLSIPLLGRIAAGLPIEALEGTGEHIQVDPSLIRTRGNAPVFALRVQGESMIEDGIFDGDIIFIRRQSDAQRGEIVAVMIDGSATVKRYYRDGDRIRLEPANAAMEPIFVSESDARETVVLGKVVGVYRTLD